MWIALATVAIGSATIVPEKWRRGEPNELAQLRSQISSTKIQSVTAVWQVNGLFWRRDLRGDEIEQVRRSVQGFRLEKERSGEINGKPTGVFLHIDVKTGASILIRVAGDSTRRFVRFNDQVNRCFVDKGSAKVFQNFKKRGGRLNRLMPIDTLAIGRDGWAAFLGESLKQQGWQGEIQFKMDEPNPEEFKSPFEAQQFAETVPLGLWGIEATSARTPKRREQFLIAPSGAIIAIYSVVPFRH